MGNAQASSKQRDNLTDNDEGTAKIPCYPPVPPVPYELLPGKRKLARSSLLTQSLRWPPWPVYEAQKGPQNYLSNKQFRIMIKFLLFFLSGFLACFDLFFWQAPLFSRPLNPKTPISQYLHKSYSDNSRINSVLDIVQDDTGFLWLATYRELVRFDGEEFTYYNRSTRDDFPASAVRSLLNDKQGNLWVGTNDSGLFRFHNNIFTHFNMQDGLPSDSVRRLFEDSNGGLWIGTTSGVAYFNGKVFQRFTSPEALNTKLVNFICQDTDDNIWVGISQKDGVYIRRKDADQFMPYQGALSSLTADTPLST